MGKLILIGDKDDGTQINYGGEKKNRAMGGSLT
jgi:hypothetical protein